MAAAVTAKIPGLNYNELSRKKGAEIMYSVFEETKEEGRIEGRVEGIVKMGVKFNLAKKQILEELQEELNVSLQKAEEYFEMYQLQNYKALS